MPGAVQDLRLPVLVAHHDVVPDGEAPHERKRSERGITSFGGSLRTGRNKGDRILDEHDEADGAR